MVSRSRPSARYVRMPLRLRLLELECRDLPDAGPLGALQPPALSFSYTAAANGMPLLHSLSAARAAAYLDFDGEGANSPYDTDGSPTTFGTAEQAVIVEAWRQISVYYALFDIDVTTEKPAAGRPTAWQLVSNSISGGYAYVGAFPNSQPQGFNQAGHGSTRQSGIAHEVGHNIGLSHQSDFDRLGTKVNEYSSGYDNLHAPIMGVDFAQDVHKWFIGHPSGSPSTVQDDIAVLANRIRNTPTLAGDGFRPDEHGDTAAAATAMHIIGGVPYGWGVIERMTDVDAFTFTVTDGAYTVAAVPNTPSGLDLRLEVDGPDGTLLALADGSTNDQQLTMNLPAGTYTVLLSSHGDYGDLGAYYLSVRPLPAGWDTRNIGRTIDAGYARYDAGSGAYAVGGSGVGIAGTSDNFRFVYTPLTGDGSITARVVSQENTSGGAPAGVMIRESLAAGSRNALMAVTPGGGALFQRRTTANGTSSSNTQPGVTAPEWVRLVRAGNTLTGFTSPDGETWTQVGSATVSMAAAVYVGLAVTAGTSSQANNLADAVFSDVTVTGLIGPATPSYNGLSAPTGLTLVRGTGAGIDLSWDGVNGVNGYTVERSADNVSWSQIATPTDTTFSDLNPGGSQRFFYRVSSRDDTGQSVPSGAQGLVNRPGAPTNFAITSWQTDRLILNWRDVSGDTGYRVERTADGGANWTLVASVGANVPSYTVTGLTVATQYTYRVVSLSPFGDGLATASVMGSTRLAGVTGLGFAGVAFNRIDVQWTAIAGATSYRVTRSTDGSTFTTVATVNTASYSDTAVTPLGEYYYRVTGVNALTESISSSATVFAATPAAAPLPPPWTDRDIGTVGGAGAAGLAGGTFTAVASGIIGGTGDGFHFVYQPLTGDGSITARVTAVENTASTARAGVMIREALTAGSRSVLLALTPSSGAAFVTRSATNGTSTTATTTGPAAPYWTRLVHAGNTITAFTSPNGVTWTQVGTATIGMTASVFVGLAVGAGSNTLLGTSRFDNVAVVPATPPARVQVVQVNDGSAQRSRVTSLTVTFSAVVTLPANASDAFRLAQVGGKPVGLNASASVVGGVTQVVLTFDSADTEYGSLRTGNFTLTVLGNQVFNDGGLLDGDGDGTSGGDSVTSLYRLYGDVTGDRAVNGADFALFRTAFGTATGDSSYNAAFDFNGDGVINGADFAFFRSNFGSVLNP